MKKIQILIADDHSVVRKGICQIIDVQADMEVAGEAKDGVEALKKARRLTPDIVLLDIAMPNLSGLEIISMIKEAVPRAGVVILSMHAKESYVHQALNSGALGYVLKASHGSDILNAIRSAHKGEYFLSSKIKADVIDSYLKNKKKEPIVRGYDLLSEREQQIFRLVVEGKSTKEIADLLFVSPKTIEKHRSNVMNKLGVHGRLELLKYAIKIGVVDPALWED
ncbi:MAG: response regulator transcription factor [Desulfobacula sp.]|uniref:response regulator n=1 Tax=Desulfobacula sp. TaxID=2593537 RepID=UPI0025BC7D25|nr:response regulator transcription factor [Desulfobacula sp.]MCD4719718.1 response regulator transcription factor [Desulfobacula sp.]